MAEETKIIRLVIDSSKAIDGGRAAQQALEQIERSTSSLDGTMARMEQSLGRVGSYMRAQFALMIADVTTRLVHMGKQAFEAAAGMGELADQLGVTVDGVQALQYAAAQNGVKLEQLETGISKFSQKIGEAASGSKEMVEALNAFGVKILDAQGKLRPTETLLSDVSRAITGINDPARRAAAAVDFFGKAGTRFLPMLNDLAGGMDTLTARANAAGVVMSSGTIEKLDRMADRAAVSSLHIRTLFADLGAPIVTTSLERVNGLLGTIADQLERGRASGQGFWATVLADSRASGRIGTGPNALRLSTPAEEEADRRARLEAELRDPRNRGRTEMIQEDLDRLNRSRLLERQATFESQEDWARRIRLPASEASPGVSNPAVKGAGDDVAERMRKALQDAGRELDQAQAFAEAANQGADAVARLEMHFKALKTAQDVFGKTANDNARGVAELTAKLEQQVVATQTLRNLGDFRAGTETLRNQNELLEAELGLVNQLPELRAREIAVLKTTQEVKAKGLEGEIEAIEQRRTAIEQNERLKAQGEEIRRANELWTAPLKSALESIQRTGADAFEQMLISGNLTFRSLGDTFKKIVLRMAAEFMALATIRPVMSVIVNAVSPAMGASLGYGAGGSTGLPGLGGMQIPGGTSGIELPSWLGGGTVSDLLNQPVASLFSSSAPAGGYADVGALLASGNTGATANAAGIAGIGGTSVASMLGAGMGIGMGAYTLLSGGGSTKSTISGIGQMMGASMMLIPGMQIPGMIVSVLSSVLPSLIGEPGTRTHNSTNASLRYGAGGYGTSGGAWGPGANVSQSQAELGQVGSNIGAVYDLFGGVKDASKVWGMDLSSWTASGNNWSYTSRATHLVDPSGNRSAWRMNEDNMVDTASAQVAMRSILGGAVGTITENMRTAVTAMLPATTTLQDVAKGVSFVTDTYEKLGKTVISIEPDFDALEKTFKDMASTATSLGLSLAPVEAEQKKKTARLAQDYIDDLVDPIALALRQFADERDTILANVAYIKEHTDVVVDMARVNEALLRKEAALKEQLYGGAISQLQDAINRLMPGGNLANLDSAGTLAGMKAMYQATYAQAAAGDASAIGRFGSEAASYAEYAKGYYAGSPEYNAIKLQIIEALQTVQSVVQGPVVASDTGATAAAMNANSAQLQQLMATVQNLVAELQAERAETAKLRAVLSRYVTTQAA